MKIFTFNTHACFYNNTTSTNITVSYTKTLLTFIARTSNLRLIPTFLNKC